MKYKTINCKNGDRNLKCPCGSKHLAYGRNGKYYKANKFKNCCMRFFSQTGLMPIKGQKFVLPE